jgi:hypothetical protein
MRNLSKLVLLSFGLIVIGLSTIMTGLTSTSVFADKQVCDKNDDNNCNHPKNNQKLSPSFLSLFHA